MNWYSRFVIVFAKFVSFCLSHTGLGAGATWPGEIALRLNPAILKKFTHQQKTIILIAGTNGKTTTAKMIDTMLTANGKKVVRNESGANLDNGIVSTFISNSSFLGTLKADYFIFEVDEATVPVVLKHIRPQILILLNLFRDQLDRYGEVDTIVQKWMPTFIDLPRGTKVLVNGDDPQLAFIGHQLEKHWKELPGNHESERLKYEVTSDRDDVLYFGLNNPEYFLPHLDHATDSIYCPKCGQRLTFGGVYFSHLGKWACGQCGFTHPKLAIDSHAVVSPMEGIYNIYNTLAATLSGRIVGLSPQQIGYSLSTFQPAFGRMEQMTVKGTRLKLLLSKNPTGFNESLRAMIGSSAKGPLLLVLNDRIPDGKDISWIWDVDFEMLQPTPFQILVSGDRCFDMGLRLKYAGIPETRFVVYESLDTAVWEAISRTGKDELLWVLPTYSAMLDVRKILTGRKIL